jgi:predicted RNA polymerase sigma factor
LAKARPKAIEARRRKAQLNRMERERVREQEDQELAAWMSRSKSKVLPPHH